MEKELSKNTTAKTPEKQQIKNKTPEKQKKLQWHPAFCSALRLELLEDSENLEFTDEFQLTEKPLQIDCTVVKVKKNCRIKNEIGKIFRTHNIFEYKSPKDELNIDTFYKAVAYACLYKVLPKHVNEIPADELTVTLLRDRKPVKLLHELEQTGYGCQTEASGIYYVSGVMFPMQIIVSSELDTNLHVQLTLGSMYAEIDGQGWGEVYASAKYMDLLHETGKGTDAREAFIHPQYKEDANGNQIPAFRFVANLYTDGKISGYVYRQGETKEVGGKLIATVDGEEYTLTPVDVDNKRYSISYKGETYEGDYDYFMLESQGNPKFYSYKCSKQDGYPHLYSPVISRLGELYLIRAEASAKLGNYTKALADLNTVRTRSLPNAGYKSLDATNAHELIMKERQLELAYEADRGFDVYRVGDTMKRHYPGFHDGVPEYPATSPLAIQYIPQSEINAYPGTLTQNP